MIKNKKKKQNKTRTPQKFEEIRVEQWVEVYFVAYKAKLTPKKAYYFGK